MENYITRQELNELKNDICNSFRNMLQSFMGIQPMNLDNCTSSEYNAICADVTGGNIVASKYKTQVKTGVDADNKPVYQWACGNTKEEFHQNISRIICEAEAQTKAAQPLWSEYADTWFETFQRPRLKPGNSADKQRARLDKQIIPMFQGKHLDEISTYDVMEELTRRKDYSQSYVRDIMNAMGNIFKSAVEDGFISKSPMYSSRVVNPSKKKAEPRKALSLEDQADIIAHIPDLKKLNDRRFMAFLMYTSLSPSEILGLRWEDFCFENKTVHIQRGLTFSGGKSTLGDLKEKRRNRIIPLPDALIAYLNPTQESGFVFTRERKGFEGQYYSEQTQVNAWKRINKQINVHGMVPYEGRHTFATNMARADVPMKMAVDMMGHADERMLIRHYQHTNADDMKRAGDKVYDMMAKVQSA